MSPSGLRFKAFLYGRDPSQRAVLSFSLYQTAHRGLEKYKRKGRGPESAALPILLKVRLLEGPLPAKLRKPIGAQLRSIERTVDWHSHFGRDAVPLESAGRHKQIDAQREVNLLASA